MMQTVLVRGTGDVASAVAHNLFKSGRRVVMHDHGRPAHSRRGMAFVDAVFDGRSHLDGVMARRASNLAALPYMLDCGKAVSVTVEDFNAVLNIINPLVLIDARMRKRAQPEAQIGCAPLTIGVGPNFTAGETTDLAIETAWGEALGHVLATGQTKPLAGEPQPLVGYARERFIYTPHAGLFETDHRIGDLVNGGDPIGRLGRTILRAPLGGRIRGLTHDGVSVERGTKVSEIDPRGDDAVVFGIGERPRQIANGVLRAISEWRG